MEIEGNESTVHKPKRRIYYPPVTLNAFDIIGVEKVLARPGEIEINLDKITRVTENISAEVSKRQSDADILLYGEAFPALNKSLHESQNWLRLAIKIGGGTVVVIYAEFCISGYSGLFFTPFLATWGSLLAIAGLLEVAGDITGNGRQTGHAAIRDMKAKLKTAMSELALFNTDPSMTATKKEATATERGEAKINALLATAAQGQEREHVEATIQRVLVGINGAGYSYMGAINTYAAERIKNQFRNRIAAIYTVVAIALLHGVPLGSSTFTSSVLDYNWLKPFSGVHGVISRGVIDNLLAIFSLHGIVELAGLILVGVSLIIATASADIQRDKVTSRIEWNSFDPQRDFKIESTETTVFKSEHNAVQPGQLTSTVQQLQEGSIWEYRFLESSVPMREYLRVRGRAADGIRPIYEFVRPTNGDWIPDVHLTSLCPPDQQESWTHQIEEFYESIASGRLTHFGANALEATECLNRRLRDASDVIENEYSSADPRYAYAIEAMIGRHWENPKTERGYVVHVHDLDLATVRSYVETISAYEYRWHNNTLSGSIRVVVAIDDSQYDSQMLHDRMLKSIRSAINRQGAAPTIQVPDNGALLIPKSRDQALTPLIQAVAFAAHEMEQGYVQYISIGPIA